MGCTSAKPAMVGRPSSTKAGTKASAFSSSHSKGNIDTASTDSNKHLSLNAALASPVGNTVAVGAIDADRPTLTGVALEYIKTLASTQNNLDMLASDFFGDHDEFCVKLSLKPATAHFMKKQADIFVCFPSNCTLNDLIQVLGAVRESPLFIWVDGRNPKTNGKDRSAEYWTSLSDLYKTIGRGVVVSSPWHEPAPLSAARCIELYFAKTCGASLLMMATKKECDDFLREMRENPVGPTRFRQVMDRDIEATADESPLSELVRSNFVQIRSSVESLFRVLVLRLAEDMQNIVSDKSAEQLAIGLASRASLHYACGELEESMKIFQEAHSILLKARNSPLAASVLHNIAKIHEDQGQMQEALELYERCLTLEDPASKLGMKLSSGDLLNQRTPSNAMKGVGKEGQTWRDSFTIPSPHDIGGATTMMNLACLLLRRGEVDRAEGLLKESLEARKSCTATGSSLEVAKCLNTMGVFYELSGNRTQAKESYEAALAMRRSLRADDTDLSESLDNFATFLLDDGERTLSKALLEEALAVRVKSFGLDSVPVAKSMVQLALWWQETDESKANALAKEALNVLERYPEMNDLSEQVRMNFAV